MTSAIAAGSEMVLFPEAGRSEDDLVELPAVLRATQALLAGEGPIARWPSSLFGELEKVLLL